MPLRRPARPQFKNPSREHIVIVGGPSNTFNGYFHYDFIRDQDVAEIPPVNTSNAEIVRYIKGDMPHLPDPTGTHDLFWANFIYSAVKLIELRRRAPEALVPEAGDILTFLLYLPPYLERQRIDWDASPYNLPLHRSSPWVAGQKLYDPTVLQGQQGAQAPSPLPRLPQSRTTRTQSPTYSVLEREINHEILMRTTGEVDEIGLQLPNGGFSKRPRRGPDYADAIVDIPRRLAYGSKFRRHPPLVDVPPLFGVLIKLLFLRSVPDLYAYLETGMWSGDEHIHFIDVNPDDPEDLARIKPIEDCTWSSFGLIPADDISGHPDWNMKPALDRTRVKIKRFDYVGHSSDNAFFLQYGMANKKGEVPQGEVTVEDTEFASHLSTSLFTNDAKAYLWGCNLGESMAPTLTTFVTSVRACPGFTSFDHVLDAEENLPVPADPINLGWKIYL